MTLLPFLLLIYKQTTRPFFLKSVSISNVYNMAKCQLFGENVVWSLAWMFLHEVLGIFDTTACNHLKNREALFNDHREHHFRKCQASLKSSVITEGERVGSLSSSWLLGKKTTKFIYNLLLFTMDSCLLVKHFASHVYHNWKASAHQYSFLFFW